MSHYAGFKLSLQQRKDVLVDAHEIGCGRASRPKQLNRYYALDSSGTGREDQYPIGELNRLRKIVSNKEESLLSLSMDLCDLFPERFCCELVDGAESLVH